MHVASALLLIAWSINIAVGLVFTGGDTTCVILSTQDLKCWGQGSSGKLGLGDVENRGDDPGELGNALPIIDVGTNRKVLQVVSRNFHTCALLDKGDVKCWGGGSVGALGNENTTFVGDQPNEMGDNLPAINLGVNRSAVELAIGISHACARLENGDVKCWGNGFNGRLGYGDTDARGDDIGEMGDNLPVVDLGTNRTATALASGGDHTCAILDNKELKCWGQSGALGIEQPGNRGDAGGQMGDNLPSVKLGENRSAVFIDASEDHTCAILDNNDLKCWGRNDFGQLGLEDTTHRGNVVGQMGDNLPAINLGNRTAIQVGVGDLTTCVLLDNGQVKCWGFGNSGRLGSGNTNNVGGVPGQMGDGLAAVDLGTNRTAVHLSLTGSHTCVVLDNNGIKCWGFGSSGKLGYGNTFNKGDGPGQMGDFLLELDIGGQVLIPTAAPTASPTAATNSPSTASPTSSPVVPTPSPQSVQDQLAEDQIIDSPVLVNTIAAAVAISTLIATSTAVLATSGVAITATTLASGAAGAAGATVGIAASSGAGAAGAGAGKNIP